MKQFFSITLVAILVFGGSSKASILTVNNNSTSPGQYTTLQAAVNAAHAGDTILVSGSNLDYAQGGTITVNKKLTLWGTGYNPIKDNPLTSKMNSILLQAGSNGTVISGFVIGSYIGTDNGAQINNITVSRNYLNYINNQWGDSWIIQENLFGLGTSGSSVNGNNILVKNNIFQGNPYVTFSDQPANTNLVFSNNVVFGGEYYANNFYNAVVSNNIFYDSSKGNFMYVSSASANTSFSNNIVYGNPNANVFNIGVNGNTETNNKYNTDPQFTNLKMYKYNNSIPDGLDITGDITLKAASPGHAAGTDGKDIGLYGGSGSQNPVTGNPSIPQISTMNILNTVIAPGTTLNVQLRAKSNN